MFCFLILKISFSKKNKMETTGVSIKDTLSRREIPVVVVKSSAIMCIKQLLLPASEKSCVVPWRQQI